jgi:hypothetical protein
MACESPVRFSLEKILRKRIGEGTILGMALPSSELEHSMGRWSVAVGIPEIGMSVVTPEGNFSMTIPHMLWDPVLHSGQHPLCIS